MGGTSHTSSIIERMGTSHTSSIISDRCSPRTAMALQSARRALFPHPPDPIQKDTESNAKMETAHTPSLCDSVDHDLESSSATTLTTVEEKFLQPIHFEGLDLVPQGDVQNL